MKSAYNVSRQDIVLAISNLLQIPIFEFESQSILPDFIIYATKNLYDLSDILIAQSALSADCITTLTFDKKASRFELFTLL